MIYKISRISVSFLFLSFATLTAQSTKLLRQPSLHQDNVVFVYANDLWTASKEGGSAKRLTAHIGYEFSPHYSPDGKYIAFSGQYDGNTDVYVIPSQGGEPQRLSFHPGVDVVQGWTPDNQILFRSNRKSIPTKSNSFYTVPLSGGLPMALPIDRAAYGELSPDGNKLAYTPITSWDPEWRNYRGGQAMPIWIVDLNSRELIRTPQPTKERHLNPVWINETVFYLSERDYASNIWSYNITTGEEKQHTFHKQFDVKNLDSHGQEIIYEQGGQLHLLNTQNGQTNTLKIVVNSDVDYSRKRWEKVSAQQLDHPNLSPNGKRALFEYRGEIFSVPKENGSPRNLSKSPSTAERYPIWSPKGDKIAWFSDSSGDYQLVISDQFGKKLKTITIPNPSFYFIPDWSPDGKYLAFTDTHYNILVAGVESNTVVKVETDRYAHPTRTMNPVWSPDSKWITYSKQQNSHFKSIYAHNVYTKQTLQITDPLADAISPVWSQDGKFIYTLASTDYGLTSGWLDMSSYDPNSSRSLYAIALGKETHAPKLPRTDEEELEEKKEETNTSSEENKVVIDSLGLWDRVIPLVLEPREYSGLLAGPNGTLFVAEITEESSIRLHKYDIEKAEASVFTDGLYNAVIGANRKNLLMRIGNQWKIASSSSSSAKDGTTLDMNLSMQVDPKGEYKQIFLETWRYMRDFLYVDNVHGAPWETIYAWYAPWVKDVRHRTDLNYLVDILSGEVAVGHSYVYGGDTPNINRVSVGLLGVDLIVDKNHYRISKIYKGERWNPNLKAPLGLPGIDVNENDFLISINGNPLTAEINPYELLENTAGKTIQIEVNSTPSKTGARIVNIIPVSSEQSLRTIDWVESNRRRVDERSNGQLAYVYIPNTSQNGFTSFNRYYFSQQDKKGVIIDERNNGGGSAADYMIDVMARTPIGYFNSKANDKRPWTTPIAGNFGPKVMLINERAGSGGDLLPYMFKLKKLGPLIGTRTWGGLVGTWDTPPFIDGGRMVAPRGGFFDLDGNWAVEGEGVSPDIEVIQDPASTFKNIDPQLEAGINEGLRLLENNQFNLMPEPAAPLRWKRPEGWQKN